MRRLAYWLFPSVLLIFMAGCVCNRPAAAKRLAQIHEGMTIKEVEAVLGRPYDVEVFKPTDPMPGSSIRWYRGHGCGPIVVDFGPDGKVEFAHQDEPWRFRLPIS